MTGHGQGRSQLDSAEITVEVRAVNNRHLKVQTRTSEGLGALEQKIETLVRKQLRRGSLQLGVQMHGSQSANECLLQQDVIKRYLQQLNELSAEVGLENNVTLGDILNLPGVAVDPRSGAFVEVQKEVEQCVLQTVEIALASLNEMRSAEGKSMAAELSSQLDRLRTTAKAISERSPAVVEEYREKLKSRLAKAIAETGTQIQDSDLIREVLIMADKADIREEIVRLESHYDQFEHLLAADESQGRKLDFLIQEIFRETNTIGSKAGDAQIAQLVVDMKTTIEQMRELVQNAE